MPMMPNGQFQPQQGMGPAAGMSALSQAAPANPAAAPTPPAPGGGGGQATADAAMAQLPGAQQAAGMEPNNTPPGAQPAPDPMQQQAPPQEMAPPPPQPGFMPNSQGQQVYPPGQGPVTEQVPELGDMAQQPIAAEPRGHMDQPLDATAQLGQMEMMASDNSTPGGLLGVMDRAFALSMDSAGQPNATKSATECEDGGDGRGEAIGRGCQTPTLGLLPIKGTKSASSYGTRLSRMMERRDPDRISKVPFDVQYWKDNKEADCGEPACPVDEGGGGDCPSCHKPYTGEMCPNCNKSASGPINGHGVPMVSTEGDMQLSTAGEGDTSSLLVAPWSQNGADAWKDLPQHRGSTVGKGNSSFGGEMSDDVDIPTNPGFKSAGMRPPIEVDLSDHNQEFVNSPGVQGLLGSLHMTSKQAILGDTGHAPDPFAGGMALEAGSVEQDPQAEAAAKVQAQAGVGDDNAVSPYNEATDALAVNVFKQGSFGEGFVKTCQYKCMTPRDIIDAACKAATLSDTIASELEPLTKQAIPWGAMGRGAMNFGRKMLGGAKNMIPKRTPWAARPPLTPPPSAAGQAAQGVGKSLIPYTGQAARSAAPQATKSLINPTINMAGQGAQRTFGQQAKHWAGRALNNNVTRNAAGGAGLGGAIDLAQGQNPFSMDSNAVRFGMGGAMFGGGKSVLNRAGQTGWGQALSQSRPGQFLSGVGGLGGGLVRTGAGFGAGQALADKALDVAHMPSMNKMRDQAMEGNYRPAIEAMGLNPDEVMGTVRNQAMEEMAANYPQLQQAMEQFRGQDGQIDVEAFAAAANEDLGMLNEVKGAFANNPEMMQKLQDSGLLVHDQQGQLDVDGTIGAMGQAVDRFAQFKENPMSAIAGMVGDWWKSMGTAGQILTAGGILTLLGGMMGGGGMMGMVGAGMAGIGASGLGDQMLNAFGFGGGGEQQQQQGDPAALGQQAAQQQQQPSQAQQTVVGQQAQQAQQTDDMDVATGNSQPGFDVGNAIQDTMRKVTAVLPDVNPQEITALMRAMGDQAHELFDMDPQEIAQHLQALRGQG